MTTAVRRAEPPAPAAPPIELHGRHGPAKLAVRTLSGDLHEGFFYMRTATELLLTPSPCSCHPCTSVPVSEIDTVEFRDPPRWVVAWEL